MNAHTRAAAALLCWSLAVGCYHYRAGVTEAAAPRATDHYTGEVVWSLAWGLLQETPVVNCDVPLAGTDTLKLPVAEVRVSTNLGFVLITVATLGFAAPARVEWKCAKAKPEGGEVPVPPPAAS
jgi:hypothetical protein